MYQSGSMVTYQAPQCLSAAAATGLQTVVIASDQPSHGIVGCPALSALTLPAPPSIDEATAYPTAKQWDAKHGAYVIPRLTSFDHGFNSFAGSAGNPYSMPFLDSRPTGSTTPTSVDIAGGSVLALPWAGAERL